MTSDPVYVDFRKYPDSPHWHYLLYPLGEDAHGRWFCKPANTLIQRRPEPPYRYPHQSVVLIPDDCWWAASWNTGGRYEVYVDIASPAQWRGNDVSLLDLDLDVVRDFQGRAWLLDEDEFVEHARTRAYPSAIVERARRSAEALLQAVEQRREPFGSAGADWLAQAGSRSWPRDDDWIERLALRG